MTVGVTVPAKVPREVDALAKCATCKSLYSKSQSDRGMVKDLLRVWKREKVMLKIM